MELINDDLIQALCITLNEPDRFDMLIPLKGIENLLEVGEQHFNRRNIENLVTTFMTRFGYHNKLA